MATTIPGILQKTGSKVIKDLIKAGLDVDLDLNQVSIDKVNNISYNQREATFSIKALARGLDGSEPKYSGETSVLYNRFIADNYFSKFEYHIQLDPPYTFKRVRDALNAQTPIVWDIEDFNLLDSQVLTVNSAGKTQLPGGIYSKRLFLEINSSRMTVVITPVGLLNIARLLPPAMIQPPESYFSVTDTRTNLALRLPDANGVIVANDLVGLVEGQKFLTDHDTTPIEWMTRVYGMSDGPDVQWFCVPRVADYNLYGAEVIYNGELTSEWPAPYNTRLDHVLIVKLSEQYCQNYFGYGIIYYNLSRIGEPEEPETPNFDFPFDLRFVTQDSDWNVAPDTVLTTLSDVWQLNKDWTVTTDQEAGTVTFTNEGGNTEFPIRAMAIGPTPYPGGDLDFRVVLSEVSTNSRDRMRYGYTNNGLSYDLETSVMELSLPMEYTDYFDDDYNRFGIMPVNGFVGTDELLSFTLSLEIDNKDGNWLNVISGVLTPRNGEVSNKLGKLTLNIPAEDWVPGDYPTIRSITLERQGVVETEIDLTKVQLVDGDLYYDPNWQGSPGLRILNQSNSVSLDLFGDMPASGFYSLKVDFYNMSWAGDAVFYSVNTDTGQYQQLGSNSFTAEPSGDSSVQIWFV